jgi:hypothetical protein
MPDILIENPILNSPFGEPNRHFRSSDEGITNEIVEARRASAYFVPIPPPKKVGDTWIENWLREGNESSNPGLNRVAMKMATGSGKKVVMAMVIAWHALNRLRRAVLLPALLGNHQGSQARPDTDWGSRPCRPDRARDHLASPVGILWMGVQAGSGA